MDFITNFGVILFTVWEQISTDDCWYKCGSKGGLCEKECGANGHCCHRGFDDCPKEAGDASPKHHTCVRKEAQGEDISVVVVPL